MVLTGESRSTGRETLYSVGGRWMNGYGAMVEWYWQRKTCPSATVSTTNPTRTGLRSNHGRRCLRPAIDRLKVDTASKLTLQPAFRYKAYRAQCGQRVWLAIHLSHLLSSLRTSGSPSHRSDLQTLECYYTTFFRNTGNRLPSVATSHSSRQLASLYFRRTLSYTATCV